MKQLLPETVAASFPYRARLKYRIQWYLCLTFVDRPKTWLGKGPRTSVNNPEL